MARTLIAPIGVGRTALTAVAASPPAADVANGNYCFNDGATELLILNAGASIYSLTVQMAAGIDGQTVGPLTISIPVSALFQRLGPFPVQFYGSVLQFNATNANVKIQPYSLLGP